MAEGVDVSEHQQPFGAAWWAQWDFGIIRVHSGYRPDNWWTYHADEARQADVPIGFYGYVVGDRAAAWQAEQLVNLSSVYVPELGWWSDIEDASITWDVAKAHVDTLRWLVPGKHGAYSNIGDYAYLAGHADDLPWWMADYGPNDGTRHDPFEQPPVPGRAYQIHQFTSFPSLDRNYAPTLDIFDPIGDDVNLDEELRPGLTVRQAMLDDWNTGRALATGTNPGQPEKPIDTTARLQRIEDKPGGPGGGLTEADIRRIVDEQVAVQLAKKEWR